MKAAAYARYSTDRQTENSIAYQLSAIREYCERNSIQLCSVFADEGESGTNTDRQGFIDLVAAAGRHEFDAVIIYDISRGSRDVADWFTFRKSMARLGVQVISVENRLGDITNPDDFLVELINVGLGQHMVLQTRQKSLAGVAERAKQGVFLGGYPPLGYDVVNGQYVVNPHEAELVRKIFAIYAKGGSYEEILRAVDGACGKRGRPIGKNSLHSILNNERYIGVYTWNKAQYKSMRKYAGKKANPNCVRIEGAVPPIIDLDTWNEVRIRMNDNKRKATNKAKTEYLLSGLIECDACGATYVGHTSTNKRGYQNRYYYCGNKYRTHTCSAPALNADKLEEFVVQQLKAYLLTADFTQIAQEIADTVNSATPTLDAERRELKEVQRKIDNGMRAILNGMHFPELEEELDRLRVRKSELEDIITRNAGAEGVKVDPEKLAALFQHSCDEWDNDLKNIIRYHITKIYAHVDGSVTVNVGVHISGCGGRI